MSNLKYIFIVFYALGIYSDYIIMNNYLGNKITKIYLKFLQFSYFTKYFIIFILIFTILSILTVLGLNLCVIDVSHLYLKILDSIYYFIVEGNPNNPIDTNIYNGITIIYNKVQSYVMSGGTDNVNKFNIMVNTPYFSVETNSTEIKKGLNLLATATSVTCGLTAAYQIAKFVPGTSIKKLAVGAIAYIAVQATTTVLSIVLDDSTVNNKSTKLLSNFTNPNRPEINFDEFPLNLLPEVDTLISAEILLMSILFNVFVSNYISKIDFSKYISQDTKIGKILHIILNRYLKIWSNTRKLLIIYSWVMLMFCILVTKFSMFYVLYN